jgi:16S rRNA processing protein RimM
MGVHVVIGRILSSHGLKGEVNIRPLTFSPDRFDDLSRLFIKQNGEIRVLNIEYYRLRGRTAVLKFREINSREDAIALGGLDLLVPEEESPPLPEGVYYYYQIKGLDVYTLDGSYLGKVIDIIETGSNDVYVVKGGEKEFLIPAIEDIINEIDLKSRRIIITPIEGLLE